jgi:uncharacterized membrane protein
MEVHFQNNTSVRVWVAMMYQDTGGCGDYGGWATKGWWNIGPGEDKHPINTNNRYFYFYAEAEDGRIWTGPFGPIYVYDTAFDSCLNIGSTAARGTVGVQEIHAPAITFKHTVNLNN